MGGLFLFPREKAPHAVRERRFIYGFKRRMASFALRARKAAARRKAAPRHAGNLLRDAALDRFKLLGLGFAVGRGAQKSERIGVRGMRKKVRRGPRLPRVLLRT